MLNQLYISSLVQTVCHLLSNTTLLGFSFSPCITCYKNNLPVLGLPSFQMQTDVKELLETLGQNVVTKKRKNVEILWLAGAVRVTAVFVSD